MTAAHDAHPAEVTPVTEQTFGSLVLASEVPVLVEFWGRGCPPCRLLAPVLAEVAAEFAGTLRVVTVDGDKEPELVVAGRVLGFPTLHLYRRGEWCRAARAPDRRHA